MSYTINNKVLIKKQILVFNYFSFFYLSRTGILFSLNASDFIPVGFGFSMYFTNYCVSLIYKYNLVTCFN